MKNILVGLLLSLAGFSARGSTLSQNDVSILLPLPQSEFVDHLWRFNTKGRFGELLPDAVIMQLPSLTLDAQGETEERLRVVGIRLDPCFPLAAPAQGCQAQVRLVWQPLFQFKEPTFTQDAAVHTFYNLSDEEFRELVVQLEQLKKDYGLKVRDEPLGINPTLAQYGTDSNYANDLFEILLARIGVGRMSRVTFMQLAGVANVWNFAGYDVINGNMQRMSIPRVERSMQTFFTSLDSPSSFEKSGMGPAPQSGDIINMLIHNSSSITTDQQREVVSEVLAATRIENPKFYSPNTMDCVSCHTAQTARIWATGAFSTLQLDARREEYRYKSGYNLTNTSTNPERTSILRSFGYSGGEPAISDRVINETAEVLSRLADD